MANEIVKFRKGIAANLPSEKTAGQILVETDTGTMYVDESNNSRVQIQDNSKVQKTGDNMTGALYVDVNSNGVPSLDSQSPNVKGLFGVKINSSTSVPFLHSATQNNASGGTGVALTAGGLTVVGGGENALTILNNASNGSGTTDSSGQTISTPMREELILASDNGISFFTNGDTVEPNSFIDRNGFFNGRIKKSLFNNRYGYGAQGEAIIYNNATGSEYKPLICTTANGVVDSTEDGAFVLASYGDNFILHYNDSDKIGDYGETTQQATLLDVNGNSSFPGTVTIAAPTANNHAATKQYVDNQFSYIYAGDGTSTAHSATTNGNTKIALSNLSNSAIGSTVTLKGVLGTDVSSSNNGVISIGNGIATTNRSAVVSGTESENWQVIADGTITGTSDLNMVFAVTDNFTHANGLLSLGLRCSGGQAIIDQTANNGPRLEWLSRHKDINPNHYRLRIINNTGSCTWVLEAYHHRQSYAISFEVVATSGYSGSNPPTYNLYTDGATVSSNGSTFISRDIIPLGGSWASSTYNTEQANGITIGTYGKCFTSSAGNIAIGGVGGRTTSATGSWSLGIGSSIVSSGANAAAVGAVATASGSASNAFGYTVTASGANSGAFGVNNTSSAAGSFTLGRSNTSSGENGYAFGGWNTVNGELSTAVGDNNTVSTNGSYAFGSNNIIKKETTIDAPYNTAVGRYNKIFSSTKQIQDSVALGSQNTIGDYGVTIGVGNRISSFSQSTTYNKYACVIGTASTASDNGAVAIGTYIRNGSRGAFACGRANKALTANASDTTSTTGDVFVVGNGYVKGIEDNTVTWTTSNAFRVTYDGHVYSGFSTMAAGADYAEFVKEWWDNNPNQEDRVGYMVTIGQDNKLHKAEEGDYIIGITSGNPSMVGNADEDYFWKYERDNFNRLIYEEVPDMEEIIDEDGNVSYIQSETKKVKRLKYKENYDPSLQESYIERKDRPEWDYVGMRGIVPCRDDGTCVAGGFCKCGGNGIATYTSQQGFNTYYVIERIAENVVSVEVK